MVHWADRGENEVKGQHQVVILGCGCRKFMGRQNGVFIMPMFTLPANLGISRFLFLIFCFALLFSYQLFPASYPHQSQITVLKLILVLSSFFSFILLPQILLWFDPLFLSFRFFQTSPSLSHRYLKLSISKTNLIFKKSVVEN